MYFLIGNWYSQNSFVVQLLSCVQLCDPIHRLQPARLLCPWDFPGKNTGVGCHFRIAWASPFTLHVIGY